MATAIRKVGSMKVVIRNWTKDCVVPLDNVTKAIECYSWLDRNFKGTAYQRDDNLQWEFIPVGSEVWHDEESGEIVTITK
jgi:hypothetical protein